MTIRTWLARRLNEWERRFDYERHWRAWKRANPQGTRGEFYAADAPRRIAKGRGAGPRTLGLQVEEHLRAPRTAAILTALQGRGLQPHHTVVDYGCGSLWVGEGLMAFLAPGRYIGLDVIDHFYLERLALLPPDLIQRAQPTLRVITPGVLDEVRARAPDVILATAVLLHVRPADLEEFFTTLLKASVPTTRIIVQQRRRRRTRRYDATKWLHGQRELDPLLDRLGCDILWPREPDHPLKAMGLFEIRRRG